MIRSLKIVRSMEKRSIGDTKQQYSRIRPLTIQIRIMPFGHIVHQL